MAPPADKKPAYNKFTKSERRSLRGATRKLLKEGLKYTDMVERLEADGFTGPGGGKLKSHHISNTALSGGIRQRKAKRKPAALVALEDASDREALIDLVLGAKLTAAKKVEMIQAPRGQR